MQRFVTIKDIAKELKISVSTVSRALRDTYDVNQETKQKVLETASKLNYKPNFNARGLSQGKTNNIGVILPFITNYYFSTVVTGIQEVAYKAGYNLIFFFTNDSPVIELSVLNNLSISGLDGLLVSVSSDFESSGRFKMLIDQKLPIVFFDRVPTDITASKVVQDDYNGAVAAVEHLIENGYKKIAHITGPKGLAITELRLKGYLDTLSKYNLGCSSHWIIHSEFSQKSGEADTLLLLKRKPRPDAIFAVNDRKAIGAILCLKQRKIKIGKEIGVIGFTNDPMSVIISPTLSTVAEPALEIGKKSCELLIKQLTKKHFYPQDVVLPATLIARESTNRH